MLPFANTNYQQLISVNEGQAVIIDLPPIDCHPPPTVYWRNIFTGVNIARGVRHYHLTLDNQLVILSTEMNRDNGTVFRAEARNLYTLERYHSPRFLVAVNGTDDFLLLLSFNSNKKDIHLLLYIIVCSYFI